MGVTPQFAPSRRLISTALQLVDPEDTEYDVVIYLSA
jgi:hypothetical protein